MKLRSRRLCSKSYNVIVTRLILLNPAFDNLVLRVFSQAREKILGTRLGIRVTALNC